jgi:hypothetical protein
MIYSIYPSKDSTIYENNISMNTGIDSILEIENGLSGSESGYKYNTRILIKFDLTQISQSIVSGAISASGGVGNFYLNLFVTEAEEIPLDYTIYAYPISQSWDMGIGKSDDVPITTDGVSWRYRDGFGKTQWTTSSFAADSTGSYNINAGGATWYTASVASQSFSYQNADVKMNVTNIVKQWLSGSIPNEGFIIKRSDSDESGSTPNGGNIRFFSRDTHTVYPPKLETMWDDNIYVTSGLTELTAEDFMIYTKDLNGYYPSGSRAKIRIVGRETYPTKTYSTSSEMLTVKYLPTSSYYCVKDDRTQQIIVPFDENYTKISCDSTGNYIDLWMNSFQPDRYYRLLFKVIPSQGPGNDNAIEKIFDQGYTFKVTR